MNEAKNLLRNGRTAATLVATMTCSLLPVACGDGGSRGRFSPSADTLLAGFEATDAPSTEDYERLFLYFVEGFLTYASETGAAADYPGYASQNGEWVDDVEGFTRTAPLFAAWLASGRRATVDVEGRSVDLGRLVREGLVAGTTPESPGYWGDMDRQPFDQRVVEAADVALTVWLSRSEIWSELGPEDRQRISTWLRQVNGRAVPDNNQHLFVTFVNVVLAALGEESDLDLAREHYDRFVEFYRGDGWFSDGAAGVFDFYNGWGIHYQLFWLDQVAPAWDRDFIHRTRNEFLEGYRYLIGRDGIPILGRSVCYRLAAPAPLVFGHIADSTAVSAPEARRALDIIWSHFIRSGALRDGSVTQGYCGTDPRVLDRYSGPASCLWSLRSLVPAFRLPPDSPFWADAAGQMPIDEGDYAVSLETVGWTVTGDRESGSVRLTKADSLPSAETELQDYTLLRRLATFALGRPYRPYNGEAKYSRGTYSSAAPFTGCALDRR